MSDENSNSAPYKEPVPVVTPPARVLTEVEDQLRLAKEAARKRRDQAEIDAYEDFDVGVAALERKLGVALDEVDKAFNFEMFQINHPKETP